MKAEYQQWIAEFSRSVGGIGGTYGKCQQASEAMVARFPELRLVRGHAITVWGKRGHWWCETADGERVDATAKQFGGVYAYEEYQDGDDVRLGKCMNCGAEIWGPIGPQRSICSDACEKAAASW